MKSAALITGLRSKARLGSGSNVLPLLLLLVINLIVGLLVYQDYGLSWDEPLFYKYGSSIGYAYSIQERLSGSFDLERAYGPSATDHKTYGPAYLLIARAGVSVLSGLLPGRESDLWHLVNFLTFQAGLLVFYGLARLWVDRWAAFAAALLFATQPVVWGYAWINPKDMPFMVFFMGAVYFGIQMVDRLVAFSPSSVGDASGSGLNPEDPVLRYARPVKFIRIASAFLLVPTLLGLAFWQPLQDWAAGLITAFYHAPADTLTGKLFARLASQAGLVPVESYIHKGLILLARLRAVLFGLSLVIVPLGLISIVWQRAIPEALVRLREVLLPLPVKPELYLRGRPLRKWLPSLLLASVSLGLLSSIRVLGPLAGVLIVVYFLVRFERRSWLDMGAYAVLAFLVMYLTWPYLWEAPLGRLFEVARHMSSNPQIVSVVFTGLEYPSNQLPAFYLPLLLALTLTEPVIALFAAGLVLLGRQIARRTADWRKAAPLLLWFFLPFLYVVLTRPPMYDGYRHFLFILPPVFVVCGIVFQVIRARLPERWSNVVLLLAVLSGVWGVLRLHPYQYTYFNTLAGGTGGAFSRFETDYWLTCYKEIVEQLNRNQTSPVTLFVQRQPSIAREYAAAHIDVRLFDLDDDQTFPGSLLLLSTRTRAAYKIHPESPIVYQAGREGAVFCLIRLIQE